MISICICTYKRKELLKACLESLLALVAEESFEIVVVDNDSKGSGAESIFTLKEQFEKKDIILTYVVEPIRGIAAARNRALKTAQHKIISFIDDDETVSPQWLSELILVKKTYKAQCVVGPVFEVFPEGFPKWQKGLLRPSKKIKDGTILKWDQCATNNVLIDRDAIPTDMLYFDNSLGLTGGEDTDFFSRIIGGGLKVAWAEKATVFEIQVLERSTLRYHCRRSYCLGWAWANHKARRQGHILAALTVGIRIFPAMPISIVRSLRSNDPRRMFLLLAKAVFDQIGKIGYFFGLKLITY